MTRVSAAQTAFSAGELSPLLRARFDYQRFQTGLSICRGFLPLRQGGITRAPGTLWRGATRGDLPGRLIAFEFAADDAVVLEFTDRAMRVWRYGQPVLAGGLPYELATPYDLAAVGRLQWAQSADVIWLCDGALPVQKLSRFALDNWTIAAAVFDNGPFRVQNLDEGRTLRASAATGTVTLTASAALFQPGHAGSLMRLAAQDYSAIPLWTGNLPVGAAEAVKIGDAMRYGANIYRLTAGTSTGVTPPIHTEGVETYDAQDGTAWEFLSGQAGTVRITGIVSATEATAQVIGRLPEPCVSAPTYRWSEGAWSDLYGYPAAIEIFDQRLCFAATPSDPRTIWFSTAGALEDHEPSDEADGAFAYAIAGQASVNRILWLRRGAKGLHVGALGEEYSTRSTDPAKVVGPTTASFGADSSIGSRPIPPIAPDGFPIFVARDGARLFEMRYSFERDANSPRELSLPSEHLGAAGFEEIAWQSSPQRLAWLRRGDGDLAAMVYDPSEDVLGWARHSLAGGAVESLAVSSDPSGAYDVLTMIVRRSVGGATRRFVEELALTYGVLTGQQPIAQAMHLFAAVSAAPDPATDSFDLPHLAGESVIAWTDRGEFGPLTVPPGGTVTLPVPVGRAAIGLADATHMAETLPVQAAAPDGNATGRARRLHARLGLMVHRTAAGQVQAVERDLAQSPRAADPQPILPRGVAADLTDAYSGTCQLPAPSAWAAEVSYRFLPQGGAPMTILAAMPMVEEAGA